MFQCDQCDYQVNCKVVMTNHVEKEHRVIPQIDGLEDPECKKEDNTKEETTSTFKFVSEMTEEERKVHEKNQEESAKADESWCYECKDIFMNNTVLKMHMHNDHQSKALQKNESCDITCNLFHLICDQLMVEI